MKPEIKDKHDGSYRLGRKQPFNRSFTLGGRLGPKRMYD